MKSTIVIAALIASALGASTIVPSLAQDASSPPAVAPAQPAPPAATTPDTTSKPMHRLARKGGGMAGMKRGDRLVQLACSDKGAAVLERLLDRAAKPLNLTASQQTLFDTFRAKALTTETSFSTACQAARPDRSQGSPDLLTRWKSDLAIEKAKIAAIEAVLPDFQALFDSLTDQQKAELRPNLMDMGPKGGPGAKDGKPHHPGAGGKAGDAPAASPT